MRSMRRQGLGGLHLQREQPPTTAPSTQQINPCLGAVGLHVRHLGLSFQPVAQLAHVSQQLAHGLLLRWE